MTIIYVVVALFLGIVIGAGFGMDRTKLREVYDLVDPHNPGKIVMRSGDSYYVFPGGYEYVPKHLLRPRP